MSDLVLERSIPDCVGFLRKSSRGDLIALAAGVSVLPLMHFGYYQSARQALTPSLAAFLFLLSLSFGSAFLAAARANTSVIPLHRVIPAGARLGARMGFVIFLVGGGMALLAGVIRRLQLGVVPGDFEWAFPTLATAGGIFFCLLPTIAAGSLGAAWRLGLPGALAERLRKRTRYKDRPRQVPGPVIWGSVATFVLCLASPAILIARANRPAVASAEPARAPKGQAFRHPVPEDLSVADAGRWKIVDRRRIEGLVPGAVAALSRDGRYLAYIRDKGTHVAVHDLASDVEWRRFSVYPSASGLAWSNDGRRIFITTSFKPEPFWMLHLEERDAMYLPLTSPVTADRLRWPRENEIEFLSGAGVAAVLDLHSFGMRVVSEGYDDSGGRVLTDPLPSTDRCRLEVGPCLTAAESPLGNDARAWRFRSAPGLFVVDRRTDRRIALVTQDIGFGTDFLISPDCARIVSISHQGAWVSYVGLKEQHSDGVLKAVLPEASGELVDQLGSQRRLAAFVYAPRAGTQDRHDAAPDPAQVRCLAFLDSHEGRDAAFHVAESYRPVEAGDVMGCWHFWLKGSPVLLVGRGIDDWSTRVAEGALAGAPGQFPARAWEYAKFQESPGGFTLTGYGPKPVSETVDSTYSPLVGTAAAAPPPASSATPPSSPEPGPAGGGTAVAPPEKPRANTDVEKFVRAHHAKVGNRDVDGFAADYAPSVELNGNKGVTPDTIRRDQEAYLARYDRLSETVVGAILARRTATGWTASYTMRSFAVVKRDGSVSDRMVTLTLDLAEVPGGTFAIVREQAAAAK